MFLHCDLRDCCVLHDCDQITRNYFQNSSKFIREFFQEILRELIQKLWIMNSLKVFSKKIFRSSTENFSERFYGNSIDNYFWPFLISQATVLFKVFFLEILPKGPSNFFLDFLGIFRIFKSFSAKSLKISPKILPQASLENFLKVSLPTFQEVCPKILLGFLPRARLVIQMFLRKLIQVYMREFLQKFLQEF